MHEKLRSKILNKKYLFYIICIIPTILSTIYYLSFCSSEFITTTTFGIRQTDMMQMKNEGQSVTQSLPFASEVGMASFGLIDFISSTVFIRKIEENGSLSNFYGLPKGDIIDHLSKDASDEVKLNFWKKKVRPYFDLTTGLITIDVNAYTPEDSYNITENILKQSENLINEISRKLKDDAVKQAAMDLSIISNELDEKRFELSKIRTQAGVLDPSSIALTNLQFINKLKDDLVNLKSQEDLFKRELSKDSPQMQSLHSRISITTNQINELEKKSGLNSNSKNASELVEKIERTKSDISMLEKQYASASENLMHQKTIAEKQALYLIPYVKPIKPIYPSHPKPIKDIAFVFVCSFLMWAISIITIQAIKDHTT